MVKFDLSFSPYEFVLEQSYPSPKLFPSFYVCRIFVFPNIPQGPYYQGDISHIILSPSDQQKLKGMIVFICLKYQVNMVCFCLSNILLYFYPASLTYLFPINWACWAYLIYSTLFLVDFYVLLLLICRLNSIVSFRFLLQNYHQETELTPPPHTLHL